MKQAVAKCRLLAAALLSAVFLALLCGGCAATGPEIDPSAQSSGLESIPETTPADPATDPAKDPAGPEGNPSALPTEPVEISTEIAANPTEGTLRPADPEKGTLTGYALAPEGYRYYRLEDDLAPSETYVLNGTLMYYDPLEGIFYTLVKEGDPLELDVTKADRVTLGYSADINGDGALNIADANAIYQMVYHGGGYYSVEQISVEARLRVFYRDIRDLESLVNRINGKAA